MRRERILKFLVIILAVCLFGQNLSAQVSAGGAIMAVDERALAGGGTAEISRSASTATAQASGKAKRNSVSKKVSSAKTTRTDSAKTIQTTYKKATPKPPTPKKFDGFTIGNEDTFFNFEIVNAVQPVHTIKAQEAGAKGLVQVEVLIGENGSVLQARARSGNKLLHPEAEKAALMTKFRQFSVYGKPARAVGFIVFRFGKREE